MRMWHRLAIVILAHCEIIYNLKNILPEKNPYETPTINPDISDSIEAIRFSVASPSKPPKVTIGVKQAK